MWAVYKKELKALFVAPLAWVFMASFLVIENVFFHLFNVNAGLSDLNGLFSNSLMVLMFLIPVLTMRSFSEEFRQKTDQLLFTSALKTGDIVLGKFFAILTVFLIAMCGTILWPVVVAMFGTLQVASVIGNYVALICAATAFIAIGVFISSATESQLISAVLSFGVFFALYILDYAASQFEIPFLYYIICEFSLFHRFNGFTRGLFSIADIAYYLSITAGFLVLTVMKLDRHAVIGKLKNRAAFTVSVLCLIVCVVLVNVAADKITERYSLRIDMTEEKMFELTDETVELLSALEKPVTITVLSDKKSFSEEPGLAEVDEVITRYAESSRGSVAVEYVDIYKNPSFLEKYDFTTTPSYRSLIVETADKYKLLDVANDLYAFELDYEKNGYSLAGFDAEKKITAAILYTQQDAQHAVAFLSGHNEEIPEVFAELIRSANFETVNVNLALEELPENCSFAVLVSPKADFLPVEIEKLEDYLAGSGQLMAFIGPESPAMPNLELFFEEWGVRFSTSFAADASRCIGTPAVLSPVFVEHDLILNLLSNPNMVLMTPYARAMDELWAEKSTRHVETILMSSSAAYRKEYGENPGGISDFIYAPGDKQGSSSIAVLTEDLRFEGRSISSRILFVGSTVMISDEMLTTPNFLNASFVKEAISYMDTQTTPVTIPTKQLADTRLTILHEQGTVLFWCSCVALPVVLIGCGLIIWSRRRSR